MTTDTIEKEQNLTNSFIDPDLESRLEEEFHNVASGLDKHHGIFYSLVNMGIPMFDTSISTACVGFDNEGMNISFKFNPDFWQKLDDYNRSFVICHECLHVILDHGYRIKGCIPQVANIAADVVINHMLVDKFDFDREKIFEADKFCWLDTVFSDDNEKGYREDIEERKSFEYYYQKLTENDQEINFGGELVDSHASLPSFADSDVKSAIEEAVGETISPEESEQLSERLGEEGKAQIDGEGLPAKGRGTIGGNIVEKVSVKRQIKKKWETVIKEWARKKITFDVEEQWARPNRRMNALSNDLMLPSEADEDNFEKDRLGVWFFQDTSGSCHGYHKRFFTAAKSLDPKLFDIRMFCFDTRVYETSLESGRLYGFGGTYFSILEDYIQRELSTGKISKYPEAVFVITDGYGDYIHPQYPHKWYWFLTPYGSTYCIDSKCNTFDLKNFE